LTFTADHILCLQAGKLVEQGTHDELLALGGHYAEMYTAASAGFAGAGKGEDYILLKKGEGETSEVAKGNEGAAANSEKTQVEAEVEEKGLEEKGPLVR
jgi:ABC-type multidrug transport system ATPase subunit